MKLFIIFLLSPLLIHCGYHSSSHESYLQKNEQTTNLKDESAPGRIKQAMNEGDLKSFIKWIDKVDINLRLPETHNATPLIYSALKNLPQFANFLIEQGANTELTDDEGDTALQKALKVWGTGRIIMLLDPSVQTQLQQDLFKFVKRKSVDKIRELLASGVDPNFIDEDSGETPLTQSFLLKNANHVILFLLEWDDSDFNITATQWNYANRNGETPWDLAVKTNNQPIIDKLKELITKETP